MKAVLVVLLLALLPLLAGAAPVPCEVILTARDVTSAVDIEEAIRTATGDGTRPGIVTLDARNGPFTYIDADKSINIFFSDVTLRSLNGATITNCDDGVFFDDFPLHDVTVTGIAFHCDGSGILAGWSRYECRNITIEGNFFEVRNFGIGIALGREVRIARNVVTGAGSDAINLYHPTGVRIHANDLQGLEGVFLDGSRDSQITNNRIEAWEPGIILVEESDDNKVNGNQIAGVRAAGVVLEGGSSGNKVHGNQVTCAAGAMCVAVQASPEVWEANRISGNMLVE